MANTPAPRTTGPGTNSAKTTSSTDRSDDTPNVVPDDDTPNSSGPEAAPLAVGTEPASAGLAGRLDFEKLNVETAPELSGKDLLAAAQRMAPNLTAEFVSTYAITDDALRAIANGAEPPPPAVGPVHSTDLYLAPGGWVNVPAGVDPTTTTVSNVHNRA